MKNKTNPAIGSSWEDSQSKLFSKEEIEASYQRVEKLIQNEEEHYVELQQIEDKNTEPSCVFLFELSQNYERNRENAIM